MQARRITGHGSVEGIQSRTAEARGVQFHPSPDETGGPSAILRAFIEHK